MAGKLNGHPVEFVDQGMADVVAMSDAELIAWLTKALEEEINSPAFESGDPANYPELVEARRRVDARSAEPSAEPSAPKQLSGITLSVARISGTHAALAVASVHPERGPETITLPLELGQVVMLAHALLGAVCTPPPEAD